MGIIVEGVTPEDTTTNDGMEHLEWAKDFLERYEKKWKKV